MSKNTNQVHFGDTSLGQFLGLAILIAIIFGGCNELSKHVDLSTGKPIPQNSNERNN